MFNAALHVHHKSEETFDRENKVIPANVIAASVDTGKFKIGNGSDKWRDLPLFAPTSEGPGVPENLDGARAYQGPLHFVVLSTDEYEVGEGGSSYVGDAGFKVPGANQLVLPYPNAVYFVLGNGSTPLEQLPRFELAESGYAYSPLLSSKRMGRLHLSSGTAEEFEDVDNVYEMGRLLMDQNGNLRFGDGMNPYSLLHRFQKYVVSDIPDN